MIRLLLGQEARGGAMRRAAHGPFAVLIIVNVLLFGCSDQNTLPMADVQEDHEHEHSDGDHSHPHTHGDLPGDPLFGGRLVSIGHTHHENGVTEFYAEIMPLEGDTIRLHILTDAADGGLEPSPVTSTEMTVLMSAVGQESMTAESGLMAVDNNAESSEFTVAIPEKLAAAAELSVVVPNIKVEGQRQNFSFRVHRQAAADDAVPPTEGTDHSDG